MTDSTARTTAHNSAQARSSPHNTDQIPSRIVQDRTGPNKKIQRNLKKPEKT